MTKELRYGNPIVVVKGGILGIATLMFALSMNSLHGGLRAFTALQAALTERIQRAD